MGFLILDVHGWGPTAAGEDPFRLGEGKMEGFVEALTEERSVDRKEAGIERGMNVAKLQC